MSSGGDGFLDSTSASIVGLEQAYSGDAGLTWDTNTGWDSVYELDGECEPMSGGGDECLNISSFGSANVSTSGTKQISTCSYFEDYSTISGVNVGYEYEFAGAENGSGNIAYITVRSGSFDGPVVDIGWSPLTVTASSDDNLYVHWNSDENCGTTSLCATTSATCITCATIVDCEGVPGGTAVPGTACDDGNENTVNDTWNEDCDCVGEAPTVGSICSSAIPIECNVAPITYSSAISNGSNTTECFMGDNGLWFSFMGTGADITINSSATFDNEMSINTGSCEALVKIACQDSSVNDESYTISDSVDGEMYYVYIAHYASESTTTGDITISIDCEVVPECTVPDLTLAAQDADGNPIVDCIEADGEYFVLATLSGGSGNTSYFVSANGSDAVEVDADDSVVLGPFNVDTDVNASALGVQDGDCVAYATLGSPAICAPSNDDCANAIALSCGDSLAGTTMGASYSGMTDGCSFRTSGDVFYTLKVVDGDEYTVSVVGVDFDAILAIYTGACGSLTEIACVDNGIGDGIEESITLAATATETVTIRTYDWSTSAGSFTISVDCVDDNTIPAADYFVTT